MSGAGDSAAGGAANHSPEGGGTIDRRTFKFLVAFYLVVLLVLPAGWKYLSWPSSLFGFPYVVAWAGALGAAVQMANGVMRHSEDWSGAYDFWYFIGPFIGVATGVITYGILRAGLSAFGGASNGSLWGYIVAAFITGSNYRQFNRLIQKAGNALFGTPGDSTGKSGQDSSPSSRWNAVSTLGGWADLRLDRTGDACLASRCSDAVHPGK